MAKLFVIGLSSKLTSDALRSYFFRFGRVLEAHAVRETVAPAAGASAAETSYSGSDGAGTRAAVRGKGYGFVTFARRAAADRALSIPHEIGGRVVRVSLVEDLMHFPATTSKMPNFSGFCDDVHAQAPRERRASAAGSADSAAVSPTASN
eukprot:a688161_5.p2 GENE.a688161_5~~a688161_5.p2  ORF type:complete len:157 (+),score=28.23 a688161_5:24-473(+)